MIVTLPWPAAVLSPNARSHWASKARAIKGARRQAWAATLEAMKGKKPCWQAAALSWVFHPKTANTPDADNAISSCKAFADGIADALGINDRHFHSSYRMAEPVKGGMVRVTITEFHPSQPGASSSHAPAADPPAVPAGVETGGRVSSLSLPPVTELPPQGNAPGDREGSVRSASPSSGDFLPKGDVNTARKNNEARK